MWMGVSSAQTRPGNPTPRSKQIPSVRRRNSREAESASFQTATRRRATAGEPSRRTSPPLSSTRQNAPRSQPNPDPIAAMMRAGVEARSGDPART